MKDKENMQDYYRLHLDSAILNDIFYFTLHTFIFHILWNKQVLLS